MAEWSKGWIPCWAAGTGMLEQGLCRWKRGWSGLWIRPLCRAPWFWWRVKWGSLDLFIELGYFPIDEDLMSNPSYGLVDQLFLCNLRPSWFPGAWNGPLIPRDMEWATYWVPTVCRQFTFFIQSILTKPSGTGVLILPSNDWENGGSQTRESYSNVPLLGSEGI